MSANPTVGPAIVPMHVYIAAAAQTKNDISASRCNLYAFEVENNSSSADVFVQFFNATAANVTLGTTVPDFTFRIPAGSNFGKDAEDFPLHYFPTALSIAVTSTRTGSSAPASAATVQLWFWNGA